MNNIRNKRFFLGFVLGMTSIIAALLLTGCFNVNIKGKSYPLDSDYILLEDKIDDYSVLNKFKNLKTLDLTAMVISESDYDTISSQVGENVDIVWNVPVGNKSFNNKTHTLEITSEMNVKNASCIKYLPFLNSLTINSIPSSQLLLDIVNNAKANNPDVEIFCETSVYGVKVNDHTEFLDLNDIPIDDLTELDIALSILPNLKTVEICGCTLANEEIAALRDKYPDKKIVWLIKVTRFKIRTDAQVFSTLGNMKYYNFTSEVASPIFKYCTELRALDLGHNNITDISEITNLKHLHTLILSDNAISDVSPLTQLPNLNYLEIAVNKIKDATPLGQLPQLENLYIVHNDGIKNIVELANCKKMNKLYIANCRISGNEIGTLKQALPKDCEFVYMGRYYWRTGEKIRLIKRAFTHWKEVKEFPDWQNAVYYEKSPYKALK